ncbi:hypothetical protein BJX64DRAFT_300399 [Aspergillus heterothallicus]
MVGAPDIITYVGVPLAVLGVLPIFYTCIRSILALRSIRHVLKHNGLADTAITRGSLMSGIIEVEIPRRRITPMDRERDPLYWTLNPHTISLPGGSWATFSWYELHTGPVLYRCQYKEELRVPPAEIVFEELVTFLLDRGAVPDPKGWKVLKSIGLWTPTGTVLLRAPVPASSSGAEAVSASAGEAVLRLAPPYDGDGILRLAVKWRKEWDCRDVGSLPPFWMRLARPVVQIDGTMSEEVSKGRDDNSSQDTAVPSLLAQIEALHRASDMEGDHDSVRFHADDGHVKIIYYEKDGLPTGAQHRLPSSTDPTTDWFTWTASALSQKTSSSTSSGLWNAPLPAELTTFARTASIPGGILVILSLLDPASIPPFSPPPPDQTIDIMARHRTFVDSQRQRALEDKMPPAQAAEARRARTIAQTQAFHEQHVRSIQARKEYEETRVIGALNSQPLPIPLVAEHCRAYLVGANIIPAAYTLDELARAVLYLMILSAEASDSIARVMEQWRSWNERSGFNRQHLGFLQTAENKIWFCYAAALVAVVERMGRDEDRLSLDMMECLRIWHTVHLG